jgi:hypothetical protein
MYLEGPPIRLDTPTLRKLIGKEVKYLTYMDVDAQARRQGRIGTIKEVVRRQVRIDQDWFSIGNIREMVRTAATL